MKNRPLRLPFAIDRSDRRPLVTQMTEGLRKAIADGFFPVGSGIPSWKELAEACGVSERIPREATSWLIDDGLLEAKRRIGTRVLPKGANVWHSHVLVIDREGTELSFYSNAMLAAIQQRLCQAGHFISRITLPLMAEGQWDVRPLDTVLRNKFDLAIVHTGHPPTLRKLALAKIPYFIHKGAKSRSSMQIAALHYDYRAALRSFLHHCSRCRIRSVLAVGYPFDQVHAVKALRESGVTVSPLRIPNRDRHRQTYLHDLMQKSETTMDKWLESGRKLPDLMYFTDDHVAMGAFVSLLARNVAIPETVRIVTLSNRGFLPVFRKQATRFEIDPFGFGDKIGNAVTDFLSGNPVPPEITHPISYIVGETFPS